MDPTWMASAEKGFPAKISEAPPPDIESYLAAVVSHLRELQVARIRASRSQQQTLAVKEKTAAPEAPKRKPQPDTKPEPKPIYPEPRPFYQEFIEPETPQAKPEPEPSDDRGGQDRSPDEVRELGKATTATDNVIVKLAHGKTEEVPAINKTTAPSVSEGGEGRGNDDEWDAMLKTPPEPSGDE
jgi:hypothetical protein